MGVHLAWMSMGPKCSKCIRRLQKLMPKTTTCQSSGGYKTVIKNAMWSTFSASCDSAFRTYFFVIGIVMGNTDQGSGLRSQTVKRRNGLRLWSDVWKLPSGLFWILIHHHGNHQHNLQVRG